MASICSGAGPIGIALIGNPGAGKSTILNGIAAESVFHSGISLGEGLTSVLQRHDCEGNLTLFDTPGLADIAKRKAAGEEVDKLLSTMMPIKIAFVVTLEKGRVKPDDAATIRIVLDAIKSVDVNNNFGVIINQLSPTLLRLLNEDLSKAAKVCKSITGSYDTSHWLYVESVPELEDATDARLWNDELLNFFVGLPETKPQDARVEKLDMTNMDDLIQQHQKQIQEIQRANEEQMQKMVLQLQTQREEAQERLQKIEEHLADMRTQLEEAHRQAAEERYKKNRILNTIWNSFALGSGAVASMAIANPAPLIASAVLCKKATKPAHRK